MATTVDEIIEQAGQDVQIYFELDRLRCDQALAAIQKLQNELDDVNKLANDEIRLIEEYRAKKAERIGKKMAWLSLNLEKYARSSGEKTIRLVHGILKLRQGRDRIEIEDKDQFMSVAKEHGLVRTSPAKEEPDLIATLAYTKSTGEILTGSKYIPGTTNFSYSLTKGGNNGNGEE